MTKVEMIEEMKKNGYATQYSVKEFADMFTEEQIKKFYETFMAYIGK